MRRKQMHERLACAVSVDLDQLLADLASPDDHVRARAVRSVCPCRLGWSVFERVLPVVGAMRKDPSEMVRQNVLHVFEDGYEMENGGLPTTPQALTNDMIATRRQNRWGREWTDGPARDKPDRHGRRRKRGGETSKWVNA